MTQITERQLIEMDGKSYIVRWYGDKALVSVKTKTGWRTLAGNGRAWHARTMDKVIAVARQERQILD